jgi:4-carboxymuconolactone decarboxylase
VNIGSLRERHASRVTVDGQAWDWTRRDLEALVTDRDARYEHGMGVRRGVLGDAHVDRAVAATTDLDAPFQEYITRAAWSDVWGRPGLDPPTRSLVTIALLAALGHERELEMHLRASRRTGASPADIAEVLMHVAVYAGVPAANSAFAALKRVLGTDPQAPDDGEGSS